MLLFKDTIYKLDLGVIDRKGDFVSGLTITYKIYKSSDNTLIASGTMNEIGVTGIYQTPNVSFSVLDKYRIEYYTPKKYENVIEEIFVEDYNNFKGDWTEEALHSALDSYPNKNDWVDEMTELELHNALDSYANKDDWKSSLTEEQENILKRILGLTQENFRIFNPTYVIKNNQPCMTSATVKIYPTANDCENNTNEIAEYQIIATFDNQAKMLTYKSKKV